MGVLRSLHILCGSISILRCLSYGDKSIDVESITGKFGNDTISPDKVVIAMTEHEEAEAEKKVAGTIEERTEVA